MASHTERDPFLDSHTAEVLQRRSKELIGLAFLAGALAVAALIHSYVPSDPSWFIATDAAPQNWLGRAGATVAAPLIMVAGKASWAIALVLAVWGGRYLLHVGQERAFARLIFAPFAVATVAIYAATLVPGAGWAAQHSFGLGGLFGDTVLAVILTVLPLGSSFAIKAISAGMGLVTLAFVGFVLGVTRAEATRALRFLWFGLAFALDRLIAGSLWTADRAQRAMAERAARSARGDTGSGLLAGLRRKAVEPALIAPLSGDPDPGTGDLDGVDDSRIRARIADVIRARRQADGEGTDPLRPDLAASDARGEPPLTLDAQSEAPRIPPEGPAVQADRRRVLTPERSRALQPSARAQAETQPSLAFDDRKEGFELPPLTLLEDPAGIRRMQLSEEALEENARMLETVLDDYGVKGEIISIRPGPVVTMYELEPAPGLKASRVIGLADDIARSMAALSARVSTVPGRSVIGIELPNDYREKVLLREILGSRGFDDTNMRLPLALGKDIGGESVVANLAKMPHLLIAGTTGSGKSVAINTMILSLLYRLRPDECRLIMIDPKMLELSVYDGIPHLLSPVVTDPKKAVVALKWAVAEMEERYRKMSKMGVRNIDGYNGRVRDALDKGEMFKRTVQTGFDDDTGDPVFETEEFEPKILPYIVVIVDEMADLMMVAGKEIEACIQRLAQMARASGIHLIMATQRPSVDVITGTIKANFPTRISFQVTSKIDSRTILGEMGAEQLLGMGDMLYMAGGAKITRCHAPFVSDEEVEEIVNHLKAFGPPDYVGGVVDGPDDEKAESIDAVLGLGGNTTGDDALYDQAVAIAINDRKCSTSYIQRKLAIGYNKAARLVEQMEDQGIVSPANHVGKREVLVPEP